MNYPGKIDVKLPIDAKLPGDGLGAHSRGHVNIVASPHAPSDAIIVSDPNLLSNGDFRRSGVDLIVSQYGHELTLQDCFRSEKRAALSSLDGAQLTGNIVNALTGHVEYAQAGGTPDAAEVIGHIQTAIGSGTVTRACGIAVQAKVGAPVCQGDVIETAADGRVGLRFIDGTGFKLSGGARMVLDEFVCDGDGTSHSALFGVTRGTFAFIVGQLAETGCLRIDTPVGSIRGRARAGGIGMMSLTALIFSLMKEVEAAEFSSQLSDSLDDEKINPKDLQLNGTIELFMRDGRHYTLDDPSQSIVVNGSGSISVVTNSATQMAELQRFQQEALAAYALGTTGPTSTGRGGSSTSPSLLLSPEGLQPINFNFDQPAPQNLRSAQSASSFSPTVLLEPPGPSKPPVLTLAVITPMVGSSSVDTAHTLNASGASLGFAINGTTDGVENGQAVTVTIVNSSGVTVETFTTTVANNGWSVNVSPTNARALSDGNYTVMAVVSNALGTGTARASQNVTVDQTPPAPPGAALTTDSGNSNSDHITNVGALSLSGIESGATVEYSINGGTTWTTSFTPVEGLNTVLVRQTDAAGNVSGVSALSFTLGTTPPAVTFDTVSFTDTGVQGDHITDNGQVTLSGTVSGNVTVSQVQVFNGSQLLGTATIDNIHHTWTLTTTLAPGAYNQFNATAIDEAGNPANATTTQTVQVNDAPVLAPINPTLTVITEDQITNASDPGQTVSSFIGASISDVDAGAVKGIAIIGLTSTNGTWQYSIDGGTTWTAVGAVSNSAALLLDAGDRIRFLPDGIDGGTNTITYLGWDETAGTHGATADTSTNGGTTAFSAATDTAHLAVTSVNDAPVATITPATYSATEQTSLNLKSSMSVSDVDGFGGTETVTLSVTEGTLAVTAGTSGAVVGGSGSNTVTITGTLAQINALLNSDGASTVSYIDATDTPAASATLTLLINDNGNSGGAALSGSDTAIINIGSVNDAPVATITPATYSATEQTSLNLKSSMSVSDVDGFGGTETVTLSVTEGTLAVTAGTSGAVVGGSGSNTVTITGTLAQINALLNSDGASTVSYIDATDTPAASATLTLLINDNGNSGGAALSGSDTAIINIGSVNDAPVATITPATYSATEQTSLNLKSSMSVSDVDGFGGTETVTLSVTEGTLAVTAGTSGAVVGGSGSNTVTITGTLAQINALLNSDGASTVSYIDATDTPAASATLTLLINDNGNSGGAALSGSDTAIINIGSVNDAPVATITPATYSATEQTSLNLKSSMSVSDVDGFGGTETVTLSVTEGTLAVTAGTSGAVVGGSGSNTVTITGTLAQINALLNSDGASTVSYIDATDTPAASATLTLLINDNGNSGGAALSGSDTAIINIGSVNDAPVATITPATYSATEQTSLNLKSSMSVSDVDGFGGTETVTLSVTEGTLAVTAGTSGAVVGGSGSNTVTITGTLAQINALLNSDGASTVSYIDATDTPAASATLTLLINDNGNSGGAALSGSDTAIINIGSVNDAPVATITPATYSATEQTSLNLKSSMSVSDVDGFGGTETVTLSVTEGTLAVTAGTSGAVVGGSGSNTVTITGTLAQINALLNSDGASTVSYIDATDTPAASATLTLLINDNGNSGGAALSGSDTAIINIGSVNDAPVATITPATYSATEQTSLNLKSSMSVSDVDGFGGTETVTLSVTEGTLAVTAGTSGAVVGGSGSNTVTITGTLAQINALLNSDGASTVSYIDATDTPAASATLTLLINDNGNSGGAALSGSDTAIINIGSVNDAPVATITPATYSATEQTSLNLKSSMSVSDVDGFGGTETVTLSVTEGTLAVTAGTSGAVVGGSGSNTVTITGTLAQINALLNSDGASTVSYIDATDTPAASATLTLLINDNGNSGGAALSGSDTAIINIGSVNDAPVLDAHSGSLSYTENQAATAIDTAITVSDVDSANLIGATVQITGSFVSGQDVLGFANQNGIAGSYNAATGVLMLTGQASLAQYQAALESVTYFNSSDDPSGQTRTISFQVNDGSVQNNLSHVVTATVVVTPVNDAPVITSGAVAARVSEEGLPNGVPDTLPAGLDTTNSTSASGTITATDVDGDALTMSLGTPSASLTSGGVAIAWTLQDAGHTLIGKAGIATIITATVTDAGTSNVALSGPIDHPIANQEDNTTFAVPVIVSDGHTTTATTLSVTIEDDSPKAVPVEVSIVPTDSKTNVMLILDLSGSMDTNSGLTGLTRLDVAKAAINELLDQYDNRGDVMVRIVTFSDTGAAVGSVWQSVAAAKAAIAGLSPGGNTNYDAALLTAMGAFTDGTKLAGPGTQNVSYFLSDGDPTASSDWPQISGTQLANGIQANEQAVWESFLTTNKIVSFGLGIPNVGTPANLDPIAFDPASGAQPADSPIIVTDLNQLTNTLVFTIPPVTGGVLAGAVGAPPNSFGADGGFVRSTTIDGVTYTFNPAANGGAGGITTSGGGSFTYDGTTKTLTVDTAINVVGGELAMVMTTGTFSFQPPAGFSSKSVGFVLVDRDGDTASSTIDFSAAAGPDHAPIVRDDHVITNVSGGSGTNTVIPDYALLYNDSDADGQTIAIAGAITNVLGATSVTHASGNVTFTDNNTNGGSFTYAGSTSSPAASDTGDVTIDRSQTGATLTGTGFGETLIGRDGTNNTINANEGNDVLIGGTGNDTLTGGAGADMMTGGGGVDTFVINSAQSPGTVGGSGDAGTISGYDVITDFATATDILNLQGTAAAATGTNINGTASSLTINGQTIKSHTISNGMITFDDAGPFGSPLTLSSTADVAAAVDYMHRNDLGNAGATVAFVASTGGTAHTYVFEQVGTSPNAANDILVDFAGVTLSNLTALIPSHILPAGVSGSPMNLGLTDPAGHVGSVTVAIAGVPSGWTLSEGTNNGDGGWTILASSVSMLSIVSPANYAGAMTLQVTMSWTNADGSSGFARAIDNVEVFAQGAPVFAWSGNDHLTGSSSKDLFVFAQPIGHDTIYSFDAAHDQLDLIGYASFTGFVDIGAHLADDANGNAVITLGDGQSIELQGVHAGALTENNFVFDQTPTVDNAATMTIGDGALMPLSGTIVNTGTIALNSTGDETDLQLIEHGVTLEGGGKILLSDSDANIISGTSSGVTLNNEDNTISGAGQLGNGELTLTNAGTIDATGTHALTIDTGSNLVTNSGVLEASGSGGMMVASGILNSGVLWANGATLTVQGAVSGNGTATIDGIGILDFEASTTANVVFGSGTGGTLKLGDSFHFNGTISGFGGSDVIDLANVAAANASISYHENTAGTGGTLAISGGAQTLELSLLGHYSADNFNIVADQLHGTSITYAPHDLMP